MTESANHPVDNFLQARMQDGNIRSTALVITFFCDVVTQHGDEIWLGSIIHALAPLGINERLTRTTVFRLVQDGWLESHKQGRRSYYRLTQTGQNYYQRAAARIYAAHQPAWDGSWTLLFTSLVPEEKRDAMNRGLLWLGYGRLAAGVYALPHRQKPALDDLLTDLGLQEKVVAMQAEAEDAGQLQQLVMSRWNLDDLRKRYKEFIQLYEGAAETLQEKQPDGHSMLLLRVLLIHEYRRILLNDPELPVTMLPADWDGYGAQNLTAGIYQQLAIGSTRWVNGELLDSSGFLRGGSDILKARFRM